MSGTTSTSPSILQEILHSTRQEVQARKLTVTPEQLERSIAARPTPRPGRFRDAVNAPGISVIAEFKRRSPSAGALGADADPAVVAAAYQRGGARAISVLTNGPHFGGSLDDLRAVRSACPLPVLRKDFVVDPYQIHEAADAGADAVLLIVAALSDDQLASLAALAAGLGLDALVEVHDAHELRRALQSGADLIGINNRDLRDFSVDMETTLALLPAVPAHVAVVSESGIDNPQQLQRLHQAGVAAVLVGGALMAAPSTEDALRRLLGTVQ
jgi:indole-3-glycerol phosphate synthase